MAKKQMAVNEGFNEILLYTTPNGKVKVEIYLQNETIWLSQQKIADLFGVQRPAVSKHLKNIFETGELKEEVVSSILEHTTQHGAIKGKTQETIIKFYNLDAIISVGYRVNTFFYSKSFPTVFMGKNILQLSGSRIKPYLV
ncbi:MAG TPA: hypothetical protein VIK10_02340 [Prolixibacteraceae bacterium]